MLVHVFVKEARQVAVLDVALGKRAASWSIDASW